MTGPAGLLPGARIRSQVQALLEAPPTLHFPPPFEAAYQRYALRESRLRTRFGMWAGLALFALYGLWDLASLPPEVVRWSLPLRFGLVCPFYGLVLAASHWKEEVWLMDRLRWAAAVATALGIAVILGLASAHGQEPGLEGFFLATIAIYTLSGLRARQALACGLAGLGIEMMAGLLFTPMRGALAEAFAFGATANAMGWITVLTLERASRESFLRMQLLNQVADEDPLTGIPNRRCFERHLDHVFRMAVRGKHPVCVAMLDVDHFKAFNDRYGHPAGDACLRQVARFVEGRMRRPLDLAARVGGEEFALVWFDADAEVGERLAEALRGEIASLGIPPPLRDQQSLRVSVGVACARPGGSDLPADLLGEADAALYDAKAEGRDCVVLHLAGEAPALAG